MSLSFLAMPTSLPKGCPDYVMGMADGVMNLDNLSWDAFRDYIEETENVSDYPFKVGDRVFFFQVTLYYVGEVKEMGRGWVKLSNCHWVHWTGRLSSLFKTFDLEAIHGRRKARTEFLGDFIVWYHAGVGCKIWEKDNIPTHSIDG